MKKYLFAVLFASAFGTAQATVIDFEDITTRSNFTSLGIVDSYQGYEWGYGNSAGVSGRTFANTDTGWASATATQTVSGPAPSNLDGSSYAWNWNGPQSLWIDFKSLVNFTGGDFAIGYQSAFAASTIQLFGYDASDSLIGTSTLLALTEPFQTLSTNFLGIQYLEIRANADYKWFAVDNLLINETASVPEPGSLALMSLGMIGLGFTARRKHRGLRLPA